MGESDGESWTGKEILVFLLACLGYAWKSEVELAFIGNESIKEEHEGKRMVHEEEEKEEEEEEEEEEDGYDSAEDCWRCKDDMCFKHALRGGGGFVREVVRITHSIL